MAAELLLIRDSQGTEYRVTLSGDGVTINDRQFQVERLGAGAMRVAGPRAITAFAAASEDTCWIFVNGDVFTFDVERGAPRRKRSAAAHGSLAAPMPATVRRVEAQPGQTVRR
ncbi:MAG TPA: hypothetical protein VFO31_04490, partial [Vicinamibacterales bacterium]|nr:hypothetical protein [Vicinamibacterales bacterium]